MRERFEREITASSFVVLRNQMPVVTCSQTAGDSAPSAHVATPCHLPVEASGASERIDIVVCNGERMFIARFVVFDLVFLRRTSRNKRSGERRYFGWVEEAIFDDYVECDGRMT
jgi:hypothetical protein